MNAKLKLFQKQAEVRGNKRSKAAEELIGQVDSKS